MIALKGILNLLWVIEIPRYCIFEPTLVRREAGRDFIQCVMFFLI